MTAYVNGNNVNNDLNQTVELRVISGLLQAQGLSGGNSNADQLSTLRNDEAFGLGIVPPVIPGN